MKKLILFGICLFTTSFLFAGATFSRVKTWGEGDTLTASDLNAEYDNVLNNLTPAGIDDYSANATEMQTTADPYPGGVLSAATSLAGEIARERYLIKQITGGAYWYIDPIYNFTTGGNLSGQTTFSSSVTINANLLSSGTLTMVGQWDGWVGSTVTWSTASATTMYATGDQIGFIQVGDKVKLTNTTVKYFYVVGVASGALTSTMTITGGSDYALADAAITSPYFSKVSNPQGFPQWFNFDGAQFNVSYFDDGAGGQCTNTQSRFRIVARTVEAEMHLLGTKAGAGTFISFNPSTVLPARLLTTVSYMGNGFNVEGYFGTVYYNSTTDWRLQFTVTVGDNQMGTADTGLMFSYQI